MKNLTYLLVVVLLVAGLLFITDVSYGQGCHGGSNSSNHSSSSNKSSNPNKYAMYGGTVKQIGKYNIEMVFQPFMKQDPLVFFLKKKSKPISNQGITGRAEITYAEGSTETITLEPRGVNGFAGQMINKTVSFICLLTLKINDKIVTVRFDGSSFAKENSTANANYTCPMHPEIKSDKPGNCPKCGMTLKKVTK